MRRRKSRFGTIVILLLLIAILGGAGFLYNSQMFERVSPKITLEESIYWNLKKPFTIKVSDTSGIKNIKVLLQDANSTIELTNSLYQKKDKEVIVNAAIPRTAFINKNAKLKLTVKATDFSMWNFFLGNKAIKSAPIIIDTTVPTLFVVNNSYSIVRGGVGAVIFKASDKNLKNIFIKTANGNMFSPTPFYKENYFISLVAWDIAQSNFQATIVAEDMAGNITQAGIKYYPLEKNYRTSQLTITDNFINGKITELTRQYAKDNLDTISLAQRFKFVNETLRNSNEDIIAKVTTPTNQQRIDSFKLKPFYPLKNGAAVASFGDHRFYSYNDMQISQSYHLGLDLASTKEAAIKTNNSGVVVYARPNGIYGNNLILYHGLGVYSLYGHCSTFNVGEKDSIKAGSTIAKTGITGLALGDHLHFGILVQGIEVRPEEWMDKKWLKDNITDVIKDAKKIIDKN